MAGLQLEQVLNCPSWLAEIEKQCSCRAQASVKRVNKEENVNLVGILPVFCSEVALHGSRLRHLQSLHAVVVETEDLRAFEPHNKPLQMQAGFPQKNLQKLGMNFVERNMQTMAARCRTSDACCCMGKMQYMNAPEICPAESVALSCCHTCAHATNVCSR